VAVINYNSSYAAVFAVLHSNIFFETGYITGRTLSVSLINCTVFNLFLNTMEKKIYEDNSLVRETLEIDGTGKVLVVGGGGSLRCALVGGAIGI